MLARSRDREGGGGGRGCGNAGRVAISATRQANGNLKGDHMSAGHCYFSVSCTQTRLPFSADAASV